MKLGVLNLSNRIYSTNTISSLETLSIAKILRGLGHTVDVISRDDGPHTISFKNAGVYDKLIVLNGALNFFGGKENPIIINNYKLMQSHEVLYFLVDLRLPFKPLWKSIENRDWNVYKKEEFDVDNLTIISQSWNLDLVDKLHDNKYPITYFPIDQWILHDSSLYTPLVEHDKKYDLIYCGSNRSGKRKNKIEQFYSHGNNLLVGNISGGVKKVKTCDMLNTNAQAKATVIIGDKNYNSNIHTLRIWESLLSGLIVFVDEEFDPEHRLFDDIYYVNSGEEALERIPQLIGKKQQIKFDTSNWKEKLQWILN